MEIVLNTFGVSLNRDNEAFVITSKDGRQRIPVDDIKSIQISRGAQITSDAVMLAIEHEIDVMFMDKKGHPVGRIWSPRYGSISTIRKGQLNFTASHAALEWIKEVIMQKMENQQALMLLLQPRETTHERERKRNIDRIEDYRNKVRYNIVKYLERMGCYRIQKSIFLANLSMEKYEQIRKDMVEVQSLYENHDSIIVCPVSSDILRSMKIIGQNINLDIITHSKNTLFF